MSAPRQGLTVVHGPFEALEDAFAARVQELAPKAGTSRCSSWRPRACSPTGSSAC
ncbi:MAG: hypothetical protein M0D55_03025 [Elusimicrobiota bacterium]|nr:MAG: hypothetical protein M0D55_03025 [Elusimicrobiota bacterium]